MDPFVAERIEVDLLLDAIFQRHGYDFRGYARASLERRIRQFLPASGCASIPELTARILRDEALFSRLVQYFSVTVTELFRDPFVFRAVREQVVPMLRTWPHVRAWCAGCATGEEVYSLALVLKEEGVWERTTLYATDLNDTSLAAARQGVYPVERIREATRNYQASGGRGSFSEHYHACYGSVAMDAALRERIAFANHNLVTDGVFGEMQLIFCRNVLIYFTRELQDRALRLFSASLVRGGFLCLGTAEDLDFSCVRPAFEVVDARARIYKKVARGPGDEEVSPCDP